MKTFHTDDNNDLFINGSNNIAMSSDLTALAKVIEQTIQTMFGELVLFGDSGTPNFALIWNGNPNLAQYNASLRSTIMSCDGVLDVVALNSFVNDGVLFYNATIKTIYGEATLGL